MMADDPATGGGSGGAPSPAAPVAADGYTIGASLLKVSGVHLTLGGRLILRDVNAQIRDIIRPGQTTGQVVALLGPSGMGKTQLFRIMSGLNEPDSGEVLIGEPGERVKRGRVGVVAQHYPLFAHRKVLGNLLLAGRRAGLGSAAAHKKAMEFLERFHLEDSAQKYPAELSGGMRQRVAIAQQFICSELLLFLDEPFSGLDPLQLDKVIELVREVSNIHEHMTLVVVTHDIDAALKIADTIWILGRERDGADKIIQGACIVDTYNLMKEGLAWDPDAQQRPRFREVYKEIRGRFSTL